MATAKRQIPAAIVRRARRHAVPGPLIVTEYMFTVPLDYDSPAGPSITLFARAATKHEPSVFGASPPSRQLEVQTPCQSQRPWIVFLQGGPGFGCPEPQDSALTRFVINKGYQILYLDYRGVGLSTPVTAGSVPSGTCADSADYLKLFRQDNNVRDLEAVRQCLTVSAVPSMKKWSILGQSFGGFVALTYLSQYPEGLREVFTLGGLAPIYKTPQEVYQHTFKKVFQRNQAYYNKYPADVLAVRKITAWLEAQGSGGVQLPAGGTLSPRRFLTLGHMFGMHGGLDNVHAMVLRMDFDLDQYGRLLRPTLAQFEAYLPFDVDPIYAILHEAIYCYGPGVASNWAAQAVGQEIAHFRWLSDDYSFSGYDTSEPEPLCFSGEMIFPFMFDDYPELKELKGAATLLAEYNQWDTLYDETQLKENTVPVFAVSYIEDMYVEYGLAKETAEKVQGIKHSATSNMYHNALRAHPDEVFPLLFKLRDDSLD